MKKRLMALLAAFCMTVSMIGSSTVVSAAEQKTKDEVIVTMPATSEPEAGFDPAYGWGAGEHVHEPLIQSTLTVTNKDLSIGMDLATDYSVSEDGLIWTVKIRDDVKFTDGEPLTAKDVAFTYNNCRDNSSVNDFSMLEEAVAVDDTTVEFHLNKPFSIWPYTMAVVGIVPEHAYDENYGQNPVGSGRYIMKQWDKGQQVIFEANPDYYGEEPKMKKVTVLFMEEDAALAAAQSGTVDVAHTAASYSDTEIEGYELFRVDTVDNRGFNLPAAPAEEKDGVRAEMKIVYPASDSVRQALAEDAKNQLAELGISVTTEGADWDTAYTAALSQPLMWGWGAHTPMELYNIYHTMEETGTAEYSPYANETVDKYMDQALESSDLEESYELWKKAQWDGETGITQEGDIPWIWLCNVDHLYFVRDGLKVADQKIHPHGHGWSIVNNVDQWSWE